MKTRDDGIVVFEMPNQTREMVDQWIADLTLLGNAWIEDEVALLLIDMRGSTMVTPYNSDNLKKVSQATAKTTRIKTAFLFDANSTLIALSERFLSSMGPLLGTKRAFVREEEAIAWLLKDV